LTPSNKQPPCMQFHQDNLHIRILNDAQVCHLAEDPDPEGRNLLAGLVARITSAPFAFPGFGQVELSASVGEGTASLGMKVNQTAVAAARLVWETYAHDEAWREIRDLHHKLCDGTNPAMLAPTPSAPWLAICLFPEFHERATPEQRLITAAMFWGLSHSIRGTTKLVPPAN
jgi:hypothetical protein